MTKKDTSRERVGNYGFTCGWCDEMLDTPFDDHDRAAEYAQKLGWRMVVGYSPRWGEGAHNTCDRCAEGDQYAIPIWTPSLRGAALKAREAQP